MHCQCNVVALRLLKLSTTTSCNNSEEEAYAQRELDAAELAHQMQHDKEVAHNCCIARRDFSDTATRDDFTFCVRLGFSVTADRA